uniref:Synaptobrevin, longin-like domain protein n=1 Tax=Tanacetum cinerariifolium TaxID=118510 RepID=A0A6L2JGT1_TANCI|nr:hypothetical protein [Tanacetum cinerariifolium]
MIAYLTKSDASEGFEQIPDFLNASVIQYALTVNPIIYVSCIKQFWSSVSIKKTNDVVRLQALIDRRKVIITEGTVRKALQLDDAESIDCLTNKEIFAELARMGYEKPSTKLTFYKAFFSAQWKFLIHIILQCMSAKRIAWNEFSSSMSSAVICLAIGRKFNFSKYIFDSLVRNVDSSLKFYMYPRFLQLIIDAQVGDLSSHNTKYTSPALTQKVFANMRRVGNGLSGVDTPLFEGITSYTYSSLSPYQSLIALQSPPPPQQQPSQPLHTADISMNLLNTLLETYTTLTKKVEALKQDKIAQALEITKLKQKVRRLEKKRKLKVLGLKRLKKDDEADPAELKEVIEVVTTTKLMTKVVTAAPSAARRRKGVVIKDPEKTITPSIIVHYEPKSKDKGKGILVKEPKPLKKQAQIEQDEAYARELEAELNANINRNEVIEQHFNSIVAFLEKREEQLEDKASKAIKRRSETSKEKTAKKQKLNEEVNELKTHLQIVLNDEDNVYTEAIPLALKVPVVDYQIHTENNKPYYKIIRAEPKNFSDDFLLNTLKAVFEKPNVEAHTLKNQRGSYGLAKVKSWKLLESCRVHIITFITTQMILLVKRRYPLTRFTLDQMLNNVRLEVEEESEVSLELLIFVRRQQQEGYRP